MALANGAIFAGYTVVRMLGSSATGELYLVQRPAAPGWQSLKVLPLSMSGDGEFRQRFHAETQRAANLYHPNIVEVHERGEFEGQLWIAMDYIDGMDAVQVMANQFPSVLPVAEVLAIVSAIAAALDHAHQRGVVHRDVKPASILLTSYGAGEPRILLADFGIALTGGRGVAYPAPELSMGAYGDERADQYALAATAMHLLTGAPPVSPPTPPTLGVLRPDLARLDAALSRALATQPADRFGSCREFAAALTELAGVTDRGVAALGTTAVVVNPAPAYVVDYPAYEPASDWPETVEQQPAPEPQARRRGTFLQSVAGALARRLDAFSTTASETPTRRRPRRILVGAAAVLLLAGLLAVGIVIGRKTSTTVTQAGSPPTSAPPVPAAPPPSDPAAAPVPLDGTYQVEIERSKQTYDFTPSPQPPDVNTWWAIRSACTPSACLAAATMLDDNTHTQAKEGVRPLILEFGGGQWKSRPEDVQFPCVGANGSASTQDTTQVLSLRPQPQGDLVGEMVVTVRSNECGQQAAVIRIPAVASRSGDVPPAVTVPDPATVPSPPSSTPTSETPTSKTPPTSPSTAPPTGPGR